MSTIAIEFQKAHQQYKLDNFNAAGQTCSKILKTNPNHPESLLLTSMILNKIKKFEAALKYAERALLFHPAKYAAYTEKAIAQLGLNQLNEAEESLKKSMAFNANYPKTHIQLGKLYKQSGRKTEAKNILEKLLVKNPQSLSALNNMGALLFEDKKEDEALACFEKVIKIDPNTGIAHKNIGLIALKKGKRREAEIHLTQALKLLPNDIDLVIELGQIWFSRTKYKELKIITSRALKIAPENIELLSLSSNANMQLKEFDEAIVNLEKVLQIQPENANAFYKLARCKTDLYDYEKWDNIRDKYINILSKDIKKDGSIRCSTYDTHYYNIPDKLQHELMLKIAKNHDESIPSLKFEFKNRSHSKIRIGYISPDFRQHALGLSVYQYFQHHNREQFEIYAFAVFMPKNTDSFTEKIKSDVDHFYDIREHTIIEGAKLIYENEIDILIDFGGYTNFCKPEILTLKPAPIQIFMTGQPDTTGSSKYDFFLSDSFLIDDVNRKYYTENILFQPHGFVISLLEPSAKEFSKEEIGIEEDTFVFCCFCSPYKYEPKIFSIWMKILKKVDNSVLLLLGNGNKTFEKNIYASVKSHGIDVKRVIILPYLKIKDHLNRLKICDLFLDTLYYTCSSSGGHVLMMGVPIITLKGETNAMRQGASVCHAAGIDELICESMDEYYEKAIELASNPHQLNLLKNKLKNNQESIPVFDVKSHIQNLEKSYTHIWNTYLKDEKFTDLYIDKKLV